MSHSNNTTFMNLPLFVGSDKPAWLTDFNSAMQAIDNQCSSQKGDIDANALAITALQTAISNLHPIGSIYMSVNSTNPGTLFGGTWTRIKDTFLLAAGDTYLPGDTGGEAAHTLTVDEMPKHDHWVWKNPQAGIGAGEYGFEAYLAQSKVSTAGLHGVTSKTGEGDPHNNMPPYIAVYVWQRTA